MNILVTGGTGFIGSAVIDVLSTLSANVLVLTRRSKSNDTNGSIKFVQCDIEKHDEVATVLEKFSPDVCVHLAWSGIPDFSLENCLKNLSVSALFCEQVIAAGARKVVLAGSCWEYGHASGKVTEDMPARNPSEFAICKNALFQLITRLTEGAGVTVVNGRIFFAYGPGQRLASLVPSVVSSLQKGEKPDIRNPSAAQDFIFVRDVAEALVQLAVSEKVDSGIYNIGSGLLLSIKDMVNKVCKELGRDPLYDSEYIENGMFACTEKLRRLGWAPKVEASEGIRLVNDSLAK